MKIVVAPDSFKGNLTAVQVAGCIEVGIRMADKNIEVKKIPVADGGEGTVEALVTATDGKIIKKQVSGPLMEKVDSFFGILGNTDTAVIEMAAAAGLDQVPENMRNPLNTTTYGVGELIKAAVDYGCKRIILGIGGSATNDGGMGMAQALGAKFLDKDGRELGHAGKYMNDVAKIDVGGLEPKLKEISIVVACDVKNPLHGKEGAAHIYGPQKGATPEIIEVLDQGLRNFADRIKEQLGVDMANIPGSGAAGGLGGGLIAFAGAELLPGIEVVIKYCNFEDNVKDADLLITGEGRTDHQTAYGKVPVGLAMVAAKHDVPVVCLSGGLRDGYMEIYKHGITAAFSNVNDAMPLKEAIEKSGGMMTERAYAITRLLLKLKK